MSNRSSYTEIKHKLVEGQWIFTCSLKPLQFAHLVQKDLKLYGKSWETASKVEREDFANDDFVTLEGSHHSIHNCSCTPISEKYALWFIANKVWEIYEEDTSDDKWNVYVTKVKKLCEEQGIEYEGI